MTAVPFLVAGHFAHVDEASRHQETMGPGILTAFGLIGAPIGGVVVVLIAVRLRRRKDAPGAPPANAETQAALLAGSTPPTPPTPGSKRTG